MILETPEELSEKTEVFEVNNSEGSRDIRKTIGDSKTEFDKQLQSGLEAFAGMRQWLLDYRMGEEGDLEKIEHDIENLEEAELLKVQEELQQKKNKYENDYQYYVGLFVDKENQEMPILQNKFKKLEGTDYYDNNKELLSDLVAQNQYAFDGLRDSISNFQERIEKLLKYNLKDKDKNKNDLLFSMDDLDNFGEEIESGELVEQEGFEENNYQEIYDGFDQDTLIYFDNLYRTMNALETKMLDLEATQGLFNEEEFNALLFDTGIDGKDLRRALRSVGDLLDKYKGKDAGIVEVDKEDKENITILLKLIELNKIKIRQADILEGFGDLPDEKIGSLPFGEEAFKSPDSSRNLRTLL